MCRRCINEKKEKNKYFMNVSEENIYSRANEQSEEATGAKVRAKTSNFVINIYLNIYYILFISRFSYS